MKYFKNILIVFIDYMIYIYNSEWSSSTTKMWPFWLEAHQQLPSFLFAYPPTHLPTRQNALGVDSTGEKLLL